MYFIFQKKNNAMDPNVSRYEINCGGQFYYGTHRQLPPENHTLFFSRSYAADPNVVDEFENKTTATNSTMNSVNFHESVIKNYKTYENRQHLNPVKRCIPEQSNNIELQTKQNYDQRIPNCTNLSNVSLFSSVIQSTSQYATHYQNTEYQERHNTQYIQNNIQTWDKNPNYFCKRLPDFSNVNMALSTPSK